ncbi:MAG: hypothetical protein RMJ54_14675 [Roseiflexaceae bacterium]|nr:hypothetical protein [Roseiflexus sp.]MDW8234022.1 hypothetical protein [Roseiflexaceae bacterium]
MACSQTGVVYVFFATNPQNQNQALIVIYSVDNAPAPGKPDPKDILSVPQLPGTRRAGVMNQRINKPDGLGANVARKLPDFALHRG